MYIFKKIFTFREENGSPEKRIFRRRQETAGISGGRGRAHSSGISGGRQISSLNVQSNK